MLHPTAMPANTDSSIRGLTASHCIIHTCQLHYMPVLSRPGDSCADRLNFLSQSQIDRYKACRLSMLPIPMLPMHHSCVPITKPDASKSCILCKGNLSPNQIEALHS